MSFEEINDFLGIEANISAQADERYRRRPLSRSVIDPGLRNVQSPGELICRY
jgi:hypothetical protein